MSDQKIFKNINDKIIQLIHDVSSWQDDEFKKISFMKRLMNIRKILVGELSDAGILSKNYEVANRRLSHLTQLVDDAHTINQIESSIEIAKQIAIWSKDRKKRKEDLFK